MKNSLKLGLVMFPLAAIGVAILAFVVSNNPPPVQVALAERATAVRYVSAQKQSVAPSISGFGLVAPARVYEAIAQVGGTAEFVNPDLWKGAILPPGSVLLRLSSADFDLAIALAKANIRAAEAKLDELATSKKNQIAALAIETDALHLKENDLERSENLFASGTIPQSSLENARNTLLVQRQKVLSVESTLALLPTQRAVQLEQIAVYQTNLKTAELNLARTELTLPFAARVASVSVETGQFVKVGQTIASLDGIEQAEVEAQIPILAMRRLLQSAKPNVAMLAMDATMMTQMLRDLELSAEVHLSLGQYEVRWPAQVDRISDTVDQKTGSLGVIVKVDSAYSGASLGDKPPLAKGMFVEVTLSAKPVSGIVVPRDAMRGGQLRVAGDDNRLSLIPVSPFLVQDDIAVIIEGLAEGVRIIVSDPSPVIEGMLLELTEDTDLTVGMAAQGSSE